MQLESSPGYSCADEAATHECGLFAARFMKQLGGCVHGIQTAAADLAFVLKPGQSNQTFKNPHIDESAG